MKEIKKYTSIVRHGKGRTHLIYNPGDKISITEKIDGANASFCIDIENPIGVSCYSRNQILTEENTLRGFYGWVEDNIVKTKDLLNPNYRYIGEWLIPHTVVYKDEAYKNFYLFSIWDDETRQYLPDEVVKSEANRLSLKTPRYFYEGEYISFEHLNQFVGMSDLTKVPNTGEGVVVKNFGYKDSHGTQTFTKIVSKAFSEVMKIKEPKVPQRDILKELVQSVLTPARVEKIIHKAIDEGIVSEDISVKDMGAVLKTTTPIVIEDIFKEEGDLFKDYEPKEVTNRLGKVYPSLVRDIIAKLESK